MRLKTLSRLWQAIPPGGRKLFGLGLLTADAKALTAEVFQGTHESLIRESASSSDLNDPGEANRHKTLKNKKPRRRPSHRQNSSNFNDPGKVNRHQTLKNKGQRRRPQGQSKPRRSRK